MANDIVSEHNYSNPFVLPEVQKRFETGEYRVGNGRECFEYILERYRQAITALAQECLDTEMLILHVKPGCDEDDPDNCWVGLGKCLISEFKQSISDTTPDFLAPWSDYVDACVRANRIMIFCLWLWTVESIECHGFYNQPVRHFGDIPRPFTWDSDIFSTPAAAAANPKKPVVTEKKLEDELLKWLHSYGIKADNQVATTKHRMDIWIPGVCFLELKRAKVSGDDVCQALDYCAQYQKPVVLVGNHISEMASRGIEAFNKAVSSEMIVFVSWSGIKTYLKGLLNL